MADGTAIEWTDATWNPVVGCSVISPGCTNCYAMRLAGTRLKHTRSRRGLTADTKAGPVWNGQVRLIHEWLDQPMRWRRPRRIFVCAHGDLFHDSVPDFWIDQVFAVMALSTQHTFQVLTKRAKRMRLYLGAADAHERLIEAAFEILRGRRDRDIRAVSWDHPRSPLPNVWLGVSVEDQQRADERIPDLLATPAAVRFISAEPLLEPIDLTRIAVPDDAAGKYAGHGYTINALEDKGDLALFNAPTFLSWLIVGGESGNDARPMYPDWVRDLRDQCAAAAVPFFFKQWGEFAPEIDQDAGYPETITMHRVGKKAAGALLDGREHREFPG